MEELINALTHGIGIIFSIVGTCMMMSRAAMRHDATAIIACAVFCVSIITLYTGSTLYHSFVFVLRRVSFIFGVLDHSFIYILIAGTYTPFMLIPLRDVRGSSYVLIAEWALAGLGIYLCIYAPGLRSARIATIVKNVELALYAAMHIDWSDGVLRPLTILEAGMY